jgi:hypothetical protein
MTINKSFKKDEDKFKCLFTLNVCKHDYDFIHELAKKQKTSIRKILRTIINNHYKNVEISKEQKQ